MQEFRSLTAMVQDATVQGYMGALLVPSRAIAACAVVGQKSAPVSGSSLHLLSFTRGKNHSTREEQQHHGAARASSGLACFLAASALAVATATWSPSAQAFCLRSLVTPSAIESHALLCDFCFSEPALPVRNEQISLSDAAPALNAKDSADCTASHTAVAKEPEIEEVTNESIIAEAWQVVNERYLDARHHKWSEDAWLKKREEVLKRPIPSRMAAYSIIRSMLFELNDPYTRFITPRELKQLSKYDMTGIGLSLGEIGVDDNDTSLRVVGIVLGSPAQMAGVKQGDELLSVNGVDVHGKSAFDASSLIQGLKGTLVSIEVQHEPCGDTQTVSVERQQSVQTPVYYRLEHRAGDLIGYIRLKEFNAVAKRDMVAAMNKLKGAGAASFLLDLRDNPGGLVQAGIEIAKVFLEEGNTVVYTVAKDSEIQKRISVNSPPLTRAPLMLLVNEHTASASEIVAAALHDNCRAVLVGHKTFGKGLIQSVFELSDGSGVILTVGKYVTPYHQDIDGNGILPDFQELPGLDDVKKQLQTCTTS